jgi:beta-lactam-binding protein with PASTA domain
VDWFDGQYYEQNPGQYHEVNPGQYEEVNPGQYHEQNPGQYHEENPGQYEQQQQQQAGQEELVDVDDLTVDFNHKVSVALLASTYLELSLSSNTFVI